MLKKILMMTCLAFTLPSIALAEDLTFKQKSDAEQLIKSKFPISYDAGYNGNGKNNGYNLDVPDVSVQNDGSFEISIPVHFTYTSTGVLGTMSFSGMIQPANKGFQISNIQPDGNHLVSDGSSLQISPVLSDNISSQVTNIIRSAIR